MRCPFSCLFILPALLTAVQLHAQLPAKGLHSLRTASRSARQLAKTAAITNKLHNFQRISPLVKRTTVQPAISGPGVIPATIRRSVFTVQSTPQSKHKGSAFAVNIDGRIWGVTARHVRDDIGFSPYMTFPGPDGTTLAFPIEPVKEGSVGGADVSLFSIPPEAQELLLPLELADELPSAHDILASSGFAHGNFLSQPDREVLFASQHRILTRYVSFNAQESGYCGSPLMLNGKVAGVHVGSLMGDKHQTAAWFNGTLGQFNAPAQDVSLAVPSFWLRHLAKQAQRQYTRQDGVPLVFNGRQIEVLAPGESINFIMQLRDGRVIKNLPRYPFMDFEHLENFFDILPGDSFRMEITRKDAYSSLHIHWYEWDLQSETIRITRRK